MEFTTSWGVEKVWGEYNFYNTGSPAADKYAFVIDSGISLNTGDLNVNTQWAKSFIDNDPFDDGLGHGTAVATVIGAIADEHGLTGVAPGTQVVPLKVFNNTGATANRRVQEACRYAMEIILANGLVDDAVVNLSLGTMRPYAHEVIKELNDAGIKVVVSAGNFAMDVDEFSPASYGHLPNVYTVSSTTSNNSYSRFTNFDNGRDEDDVDYAAPGSNIPVYSPDGGLRNVNGTSFSAPHVAGLLLMGGIKEGPTYKLTSTQANKGMVPDPLALLDINTCPEPEPIIIEVPVPGPVVEVPIYIEVPGPVVEVPVYPPQTTFVGNLNERNKIKGSNLDDVIIGGTQKDVLRGKSGDDYIIGNGGKDKIYGGKGADTFVLSIGDGYTIIKDFDPAVDIISAPSDDLEFVAKGSNTKLYSGGDLVARINASLDTLM